MSINCGKCYELEKWTDIVWYEWLYEISNFGNVKSKTRKTKYIYRKWNISIPTTTTKLWKNIIQANNIDWYKVLWLYKNWVSKQYRVNRLMWLTFIPNPENKPIVNHKDWNKQNNNLDNLEWVTHSENQIHAYRYLGIIPSRPNLWKFWKDNKNSRKVVQKTLQWEVVKIRDCMNDIIRELKLNHISDCCNSKRNKCWWYIWEFYNLNQPIWA